MYCEKSGAVIHENATLCKSCGGLASDVGASVGQNSVEDGIQKESVLKSIRKPNKKIIPILIGIFIILVILIGCGSSEDDSKSNDVNSDNEINSSDDANSSDGADSSIEVKEVTLDEIKSSVQKSESGEAELIRDPANKAAIPQQKFDALKQGFAEDTFEPVDYPFYFNPEFKVTFDQGVSYYVMKDVNIPQDQFTAILKFEGDERIYKAPYHIYSFASEIDTQVSDDFAYMHVFADGADKAGSIDNVMKCNEVWFAVLNRYKDLGFEIAETDSFRIDSCNITEVPDADPRLSSVLLEYSILPKTPGTIPNDPQVWEEDGWIRGNYLIGALWTEERDSTLRTYILGLEYDGDALNIYNKSNAENVVK